MARVDLTLSTRVFESRARDVESAILAGEGLGFDDFELQLAPDASVSESTAASLASRGLRVRAVELPYPLEWSAHVADGGASLASTSDRSRQEAIARVVRLGEAASLLGTDVVIASLGAVEWEGAALCEVDAVRREVHGARAMPSALEGIRVEVAGRAAAAADRACRSLHEILKRLPDRRIALVGGRLPRDLADPERLRWILDDFHGKPVFYWHHTGFAEGQRTLGLAESGEWLDRLGARLLGFTLHDALGLETHLVPGRGAVDFRLLRDYSSPRMLRVLELRPGAAPAEVTEARRCLARDGLA